MSDEANLLEAIRRQPADDLAWLALGDCLEEAGQPDRASLLRLWRQARSLPWNDRRRRRLEPKIARLLLDGVRPAVPVVENSLGMRFALVPSGTFCLGSEDNDPAQQSDERPMHEVEMAQPYWMGVFPVTQAQYRKVMRGLPSAFRPGGRRQASVVGHVTDDFPVDSVSWTKSAAFCRKLGERPAEREAGRTYRLPTEAEWEYACRAAGACSTVFLFGDQLSSDVANFNGGRPFPDGGIAPKGPHLDRPCPVGRYPPNALGLHDVLGNVWEWCDDWFTTNYEGRDRAGSRGPATGSSRVLRGGSWSSYGWGCRIAYRNCIGPEAGNDNFGLRVVMVSASDRSPPP